MQKLRTYLQVLPALHGGGVERGTLELAKAQVDAGARALVASAGGALVNGLTQVKGEHFLLPLASKNPLTILANAYRLYKLIQKQKVDLVHVRSRAPAWSAYLATKWAQVPLVTTFHGTYGLSPLWLKRPYNRIMLKGQKTIAVSHFIHGHILKNYTVSSQKLVTIQRGVDLEVFNPEKVTPKARHEQRDLWGGQEETPVIFLPGRMTRWKGQGLLLKALQNLKDKNWLCIMAGSSHGHDDFAQELQGQIEASNLRIKQVPSMEDMTVAYGASDIVVSASTRPEAFGRITAEAQVMAKIVIAPSHGGALEQILDGETGFLFTPNNVDSLTQILEQALGLYSQNEAKVIGKRAREHACQNFSCKGMTNKILGLYDELLQEKN